MHTTKKTIWEGTYLRQSKVSSLGWACWEDISQVIKGKSPWLGMVIHTCNPSMQKPETEESQVQG